MSSNHDADDFPYLSEEDINLLHSIIVTAEADTTSYKHPIRTVFAAYYTVLAAHDINPDNDSLYLRFLLRMREGAAKNDSLLRSFTRFLRRLGIQVVFDQEDDHTAASFQSSSPRQNPAASSRIPDVQTEETLLSSTSAAGNHALITPLRRRESFTNLEDTIQSRRGLEREPRSADRAPVQPRSVSIDFTRNDPRRAARSSAHVPMRSALKNTLESFETGTNTASNPARQTAVQIREDPSLYEFERASDASLGSREDSRVVGFKPGADRASNPESDGEASARKLRFHFLAAHACEQFWSWRRRANALRQDRAAMLDEARAFDRRVLRKQAFEQWRSSYGNRSADPETKQFFEGLEKRAGQARDLYLLTKAFTHWAQCASDEVHRTSTARRHILRSRYFNAWRDVTVVSELKARQQALSKFLVVWKKRNALVSELQVDAFDFRQEHLASNIYRNWFWSFCDRKAPVYYSGRLVAKAFEKWTQVTKNLRGRRGWTDNLFKLELSRRTLNRCKDRLAAVQSSDSLANEFRKRSLLLGPMQALRREVEYRPRHRMFVHDVEARHAQTTLWKLHQKTCHAKEAHSVSEARLMKHAFHAWNDSLRYQVMKRTIDDRVSTQALYKWVITERLRLAERVHLEDIKRRFLERWQSKLELLCGALGRAEYRFSTGKKEHATRKILSQWSHKSRVIAENDNAAVSRHASKLTHGAMETMTAAQHHGAHLERVASDARFFSLGSLALKRWREATLSTRKSRRREAYSTFRREQKQKSARTIVRKWHLAAQKNQSLRSSAEDARQQQLLKLIQVILQTWSSQLHSLDDMTEKAWSTDHHRLLRNSFAVMSRKIEDIRSLASQADDVFSAAVEAQAAHCFQRMAWHVFQIRRHGDTATSFADRTGRKHQRLMLRHWADKATTRTKQDFSQTVAVPDSLLDEVDEEANTFDPGASLISLPEAKILATPGYLRTPSRRTSRARAIGNRPVGSTPATTQITPFWNRMREVYPASAPRTERLNFGRSGRWKPTVIPESSPPA